jgi:hypothetical protein
MDPGLEIAISFFPEDVNGSTIKTNRIMIKKLIACWRVSAAFEQTH